MEGTITLGGEHVMEYVCDTLLNYTLETFGFC